MRREGLKCQKNGKFDLGQTEEGCSDRPRRSLTMTGPGDDKVM